MSRTLADLLQKAQKLKSGFSGARERLSRLRVEASSPDGLVRVVASGDKQIVSIETRPGLAADPPAEARRKLEETCNEALKKAEGLLKEEIDKTLGELGINFPGLF
ncbi:MAG: YbaB/EbfC family nucleoid-associated protein [Nitrospinae bacterium]|nr:YbaB/EbfC family nucleoid-associated protein [Nitrospinota bacterium]